MDNLERALDWEDTIVKDGEDFSLVPAGDYYFEVKKFERGRFNGSEKMPACHQATLTIEVDDGKGNKTSILHTLLLHTKTEWRLSQFFAAIGQKKKGQPLRMDWNRVVGSRGKCKVFIDKYKTQGGVERESNKIDKFYPADETPVQQPTYQGYSYQQNQQYQPSQTYPQNKGGGSYTPGQF